MPKRTRIALILLAIGAVTMLALGWRYLSYRARTNTLEDRVGRMLDLNAANYNSILALTEAEAAASDYLVTRDPADLRRYTEAVQNWKDESGALAIFANEEKFVDQPRELTQKGSLLIEKLTLAARAREAGQPVTPPGSGDAVQLRKLAARIAKHEESEIGNLAHAFQKDAGWFRRWVFAMAGILFFLIAAAAVTLIRPE